MKDIQVIGNSYQKGSFELLPESIDRLHACHYFCNQVQRNATLKDEIKARWYFRAALSGFQSVLDSLNGEIKKRLGRNLWKGSEQKQKMHENVLVKLLTKVRNFAVHSAHINGELKKYEIIVVNEQGSCKEETCSLFFNELNKKTNFADSSNVLQEEIEWFNRQSLVWPVNLLIKEGLYQASGFVQHFCIINKIV
jgi:hypothetical protein